MEGLSVRIMGIGSHISLLSWRSKHHDFTITPRNKRNGKSANVVASVSRGRLKECNQTRKLSVFFGRIALATY